MLRAQVGRLSHDRLRDGSESTCRAERQAHEPLLPEIVEQALRCGQRSSPTARWWCPSTAFRSSPASQRIHRRHREWSACAWRRRRVVAFDCWPRRRDAARAAYVKRRARLAALVTDPVELTPATTIPWPRDMARGTGKGCRQGGEAPTFPESDPAWSRSSACARPTRWSPPSFAGGGHCRVAHPRPVRDEQNLHVVGHTSGFRAAEARAAACSSLRTTARPGRAQPLEIRRRAGVGRIATRTGLRDRLRPHHRASNTPRSEVPALARRQGSGRVFVGTASGLRGGASAHLWRTSVLVLSTAASVPSAPPAISDR